MKKIKLCNFHSVKRAYEKDWGRVWVLFPPVQVLNIHHFYQSMTVELVRLADTPVCSKRPLLWGLKSMSWQFFS